MGNIATGSRLVSLFGFGLGRIALIQLAIREADAVHPQNAARAALVVVSTPDHALPGVGVAPLAQLQHG
jgi:hypothetical protein